MKFTIHHNTTNEDEYDEIMGVIMKWERIDALNQNAISTKEVIEGDAKAIQHGYNLGKELSKKGCGDFYYFNNKLCGVEGLCDDCEKLNQSEVNSHQPSPSSEKGIVLEETTSQDRTATDDIHSQNKVLLDGDYNFHLCKCGHHKNRHYRFQLTGERLACKDCECIKFALTTNKVGDKQ